MKKKINIIITGGKTGGHLFPGIAIAQAILSIEPESRILFIGTNDKFETKTLDKYDFMHESISSIGIKGKTLSQKIQAVFTLPVSIIQARGIIKRFRPDLVIGVGGYSSGPVVLCSKICGIPTAIQEQNSVPGVTNRILAWIVDTVFTSFKDTKFDKDTKLKHFYRFFNNKKIIYTGNPVRRNKNIQKPESICFQDERNNRFTILVTGGSQGAKSINTAFINAVKQIKSPEKFRIIHQSGYLDEKRVKEAYAKMQIPATAKAFFHDMQEVQKMADLIICRAGAGTISELTCLGKPSILVPYPYAADDHQSLNAKALADSGAAWIIPDNKLNGTILLEKIECAINNPETLSVMAEKARQSARPDADKNIARHCIKMACHV